MVLPGKQRRKYQFIGVFIVGYGLCAVPENVRQITGNDTQVVPYKVFAFYANTSINWNLQLFQVDNTGDGLQLVDDLHMVLPLLQLHGGDESPNAFFGL